MKKIKKAFYFLFLTFTIVSILRGESNIGEIKIDLSPKIAPEPVQLELSKEIKEDNSLLLFLTLKMGKNIHIYASESLFFKIFIDSLTGLDKPEIILPSSHMFKNFDKSEVQVFIGGQKIEIRCGIKKPQWLISGLVNFQACDTAMCFTPVTMRFKATNEGILSVTKENFVPFSKKENFEKDVFKILDEFNIVGKAGGYLDKKEFSKFLENPQSNRKEGFDNKNILLIILLVLLGGVALNFTPCVLPVVPITLAVIGAGSKAKSKTEGFFAGALYGLSMALTYGILGVIVIITGTQFGVINSSPFFNIAVSIIFFIMSIALFDIFQIDFSSLRGGWSSNAFQKSKYVGIFIMGIITSLLAGACVAPVVISVVLYAGSLYAKGNFAALFFPFLLGIGMALPWPFAGAGFATLPKPGNWMIGLKKFFGVIIFLIGIYYGYSGVSSFIDKGKEKKDVSSGKEAIEWYTSLSDALSTALREDKPVFIDFWATWCKNCKAMETITFKEQEIRDLFKRYVCVKFQAENPGDEFTAKMLNYFKIVGLPSYVVLEPKKSH